ncbi:MAG: hypothetical protein UMU75_12895 [Halomonas sp.]|nr:hypothetical protein [Halomonas sp.]
MHNAILTAAVIAIGTFGAGSLFAQDNAKEDVQPGTMHDMMKEGGMHGGMMMGEGGMHGNMMGQMHDMMAKCNAMMQTRQPAGAEDAKART